VQAGGQKGYADEMVRKKNEIATDLELAAEAKSLVALAFRNGPIEGIHAGKECPTCAERSEYSHISDAEMKQIMKRAVDKIYALLCIRKCSPDVYRAAVKAGNRYTINWDLPERSNEEIDNIVRLAELLA